MSLLCRFVNTSGALPLWRLYLKKLIWLVSSTTGLRQTVLKLVLSVMQSLGSNWPSNNENSWQHRHSDGKGSEMHFEHEHQFVSFWRGLFSISRRWALAASSICLSSSSVYSGSSWYQTLHSLLLLLSSLATENHQRTDVYFPAHAW